MKKKTMHKLKKTKVSEKKLSESCDIEYMEKEVYNKPESGGLLYRTGKYYYD